jgi:hypothetical protein
MEQSPLETQSSFEIPRLRTLARHTVPRLIEGTLVPLALFYGALWIVGVWAALASALLWSYTAITFRLLTRRRVPGLLMLGAAGITARTVVAVTTGSVYLYFLQPTLTTIAIAGLFLISVAAGRPIAERLAADFCPLPVSLLERLPVRRFFARITLLWAFLQLVNAGLTLGVLLRLPVGTYVVSKMALSLVITVTGVALSTLHFKRSMRRHGILAVRRHADAV